MIILSDYLNLGDKLDEEGIFDIILDIDANLFQLIGLFEEIDYVCSRNQCIKDEMNYFTLFYLKCKFKLLKCKFCTLKNVYWNTTNAVNIPK